MGMEAMGVKCFGGCGGDNQCKMLLMKSEFLIST